MGSNRFNFLRPRQLRTTESVSPRFPSWISTRCLWQHKRCNDCISTRPHTDSIINSTSMSERRLHISRLLVSALVHCIHEKEKNLLLFFKLKQARPDWAALTRRLFFCLLYLRCQICHISSIISRNPLKRPPHLTHTCDREKNQSTHKNNSSL